MKLDPSSVLIALTVTAISVVTIIATQAKHEPTELGTATWALPSCPRELTLQDGSRWAMPQWSEPGCSAEIEFKVTPIQAEQLR